jgi:hypothetical protein
VRRTRGPVLGFWDFSPSRDMIDSLSVPFGPSSTRDGTKSTSSATTASADSSLRRRRRRPFRREGRSPRVRTRSFTARAPDLRRRALVTRASRFFARSPCSAPPHPVLVHRPAISLPASFTPSSGPDALRFASLAVTSSRVDFHLQDRAHAGRTKKNAPGGALFYRSGRAQTQPAGPW